MGAFACQTVLRALKCTLAEVYEDRTPRGRRDKSCPGRMCSLPKNTGIPEMSSSQKRILKGGVMTGKSVESRQIAAALSREKLLNFGVTVAKPLGRLS